MEHEGFNQGGTFERKLATLQLHNGFSWNIAGWEFKLQTFGGVFS
jgi:hypothetical protein